MLVVIGDLDWPDIQAHSAVLAQRVSGARIVEIHGTAHLPHLEADPTCLSSICDFVESLDSA
jgi:pimeloyl-ACP methyl ester carboxylesterase